MVANLLVIASTLLIGGLLRVRRDQNALLAERNRQLEALQETETRTAVVEERMRIAREVHDVVGHSLVAITLQARAGLRRLPRSPERAGQAGSSAVAGTVCRQPGARAGLGYPEQGGAPAPHSVNPCLLRTPFT